MKNHFEEDFEIEYSTVTELVTAAVLNGIIDSGIKDDLILYIDMVRNKERYYEPTDLKITDDGVEIPLTLKSLKGFLRQWKKESDFNKKKLGITQLLKIELLETNKTSLICDKKYLLKLYADYDGEIWQNVEPESFLDYMRVEPIGLIRIVDAKNKNKVLGRWLHENIEEHRDKILVPNMGEWFKKLIRKNISYSDQFK